MKKILLLLVLMPIYLTGQNLIQAEYFFDQDPGYGSGITLNFNSQQSVNLAANLYLGNVPPGFHTLYYRFKDNANGWGQTFHSNVLIGAEKTKITEAEYFFDTDPGYGNGISLQFDDAENINLAANLYIELISPGLHKLSYRFKNEKSWGPTLSNLVYKPSTPEICKVVYWFDEMDEKNQIDINPKVQNLSLEETIDISSLDKGEHSIHFYVQNVTGDKSAIWSSSFNASSGTGLPASKENSVGFYPNPASDHIYFKDKQSAEQISIVSTSGKIVLSIDNAHSIKLNDFTEGVYFITYKLNNQIHAAPLIIKK